MDGILLYRNPKKGMEVTVGIKLNAAQAQAWDRAKEDYSKLSLQGAHLSHSWHLIENDVNVFMSPKPWPIASFYEIEHLKTLNDGKLPQCLVLVALSSQDYISEFSPSMEEARSRLQDKIGKFGGIVEDNEAGGITVTWLTPEGNTIIVAYAVPLQTK